MRGARWLAGGPKQPPGAELPRETRPLQRPPGRRQGRGGGLVLDIRYTTAYTSIIFLYYEFFNVEYADTYLIFFSNQKIHIQNICYSF